MMTKRWIALFLAALMGLTISACGQGPEAGTGGDSVSLGTESKSDTLQQTDITYLESTYKVPGENIYVDVPGYKELSRSYVEVFEVYPSRYVSFTAATWSEANNCEEAHEKAIEAFMASMTDYEGGVNSIEIVTDEQFTVNGIEVYAFEGSINYGRSNIHDGYARGYSFLIEGVPCSIIGSVIDYEQEQETIDLIEAIVDEMIYTVRTEP